MISNPFLPFPDSCCARSADFMCSGKVFAIEIMFRRRYKSCFYACLI
ncbi:hypothetical protein SLEP1_g54216 [Rubroshorea leprosula]|uniref:Uncharacterized protein n=1 Tax=Rubroshorea leprosula TaxID=152421 RepID=A0AAV5ME63_9ROSI|nr:hypothetical protein SLEP1_g54216 [Rubroshorea leprosula]